MTDKVATSISRMPSMGSPQATPVTTALAAGGSQDDPKIKRDQNGYPTALTQEQTNWLKKLDGDYMKLPTKPKNKERKTWLETTLKTFCDAFPGSLIANSNKETKLKVDRHFYNAKKEADDTAAGKSSLFSFEKKPEVTTALALFTEENKAHLLALIKARRIEEGLDTKANLPLFNKIRSEEFKKCSLEEKAAWEDYAKSWNEAALATWEEQVDEEVLLRNQHDLQRVLRSSLSRLVGHQRHQAGAKLQIHLQASLIRQDGTFDSFEINIGKDAAGKHYHESNTYQAAKPNSTWTDWNTHVHGAEYTKLDLDLENTKETAPASLTDDSSDEEDEQPRRPRIGSRAAPINVVEEDEEVNSIEHIVDDPPTSESSPLRAAITPNEKELEDLAENNTLDLATPSLVEKDPPYDLSRKNTVENGPPSSHTILKAATSNVEQGPPSGDAVLKAATSNTDVAASTSATNTQMDAASNADSSGSESQAPFAGVENNPSSSGTENIAPATTSQDTAVVEKRVSTRKRKKEDTADSEQSAVAGATSVGVATRSKAKKLAEDTTSKTKRRKRN